MKTLPSFQNKPQTKAKRIALRSNPTWAEYVLWQELRSGRMGLRFRRQFGIGPFIVDFYCHTLKLIIEVDGPVHDDEENMTHDKEREHYLLEYGYRVIWFKNDEVLFKRPMVMETIKLHCGALSGGAAVAL